MIKPPLSTYSWQRCVMMLIVVFGHNLRIVHPSSPVLFIRPFRQYDTGGVEHGGQKKKGKRNCRGVQMRHGANCQCKQCCRKECLPFLMKPGQPSVGTPEREQNGTKDGRYQNAPFSEMPACIDIVIQEDKYEQTAHIEFPCAPACGHS